MAYQNNARRGGGKQYSNANRIALWENDRATGDRDPQHKGSITELDCPHCGAASDYWVSLWENSNGGGNAPIFSGSVQPKDDNSRRPPARSRDDRDDRPVRSRDDRPRNRDDRGSGRGDERSDDRYRDTPPPHDRYSGPDELDDPIPF